MKKYKVIIQVMLDPSKGDETKSLTFKVEAESPSKAEMAAEKMLDEQYPETYAKLSIFQFITKEI